MPLSYHLIMSPVHFHCTPLYYTTLATLHSISLHSHPIPLHCTPLRCICVSSLVHTYAYAVWYTYFLCVCSCARVLVEWKLGLGISAPRCSPISFPLKGKSGAYIQVLTHFTFKFQRIYVAYVQILTHFTFRQLEIPGSICVACFAAHLIQFLCDFV